MKLLVSNPSSLGQSITTSRGVTYAVDHNGNAVIEYEDWGYFAAHGFAAVERGVGLCKNFSATYSLANATLAAGSLLTIPHGLGAVPSRVWAELHNVAAEGGYNPGDVLDLPNSYAGAGYGALVYANATNICLAATAATIGPWAVDYLGAQTLTSAKWNVVVKAFLIT